MIVRAHPSTSTVRAWYGPRKPSEATVCIRLSAPRLRTKLLELRGTATPSCLQPRIETALARAPTLNEDLYGVGRATYAVVERSLRRSFLSRVENVAA